MNSGGRAALGRPGCCLCLAPGQTYLLFLPVDSPSSLSSIYSQRALHKPSRVRSLGPKPPAPGTDLLHPPTLAPSHGSHDTLACFLKDPDLTPPPPFHLSSLVFLSSTLKVCGIKASALFRWRGTSVYLPIKWDLTAFHQPLTSLLSPAWVQLHLTGGWGENG